MKSKPPEHTLLCLDDHEAALFLRQLVLEKEGFKVIAETTRDGALQSMSSEHVDLVVADQELRGCLGTDVAIEMKQRWPDVLIVLLSGAIDLPDNMPAIDAFVSKSEGREVLVATIRRLLAGRSKV